MMPIKNNHTGKNSQKSPDEAVEKSKTHIIVKIIGYMTNPVVIKTIIKKSTGNVSIMSFDSGEGLTGKTSPFAQIIEEQAEMVIGKVAHMVKTGEGIVIPAYAPKSYYTQREVQNDPYCHQKRLRTKP